MGTERHGWRRVEAFSLALRGMQDLLTKVIPGSLVVQRDRGRGASVQQRRTSQSTGAAGDAFLESDVSGRRLVTLVVRRPRDRSRRCIGNLHRLFLCVASFLCVAAMGTAIARGTTDGHGETRMEAC